MATKNKTKNVLKQQQQKHIAKKTCLLHLYFRRSTIYLQQCSSSCQPTLL